MTDKIADYYALNPRDFDQIVTFAITPTDTGFEPTPTMALTVVVGRASDKVRLEMVFRDVVGLKIDDLRLHKPDLFEITDMAESGWERDHRFRVKDCCQGPVEFYCADFESRRVESTG